MSVLQEIISVQEKAGLLYRQVNARNGAQLTPASGPCMILTGNVRLPRVNGLIKLIGAQVTRFVSFDVHVMFMR
jgi:hypothetical protein